MICKWDSKLGFNSWIWKCQSSPALFEPLHITGSVVNQIYHVDVDEFPVVLSKRLN